MQYLLNHLADTQKLAHYIYKNSNFGDYFFLEGEVGAGKSTFVKYFLAEFNLEYAGSPTFGIANQYLTSNNYSIVHIDLYRYTEKQDLSDLMDYNDSMLIIEWASRSSVLPKFLPNPHKLEFVFENNQRMCYIYPKDV